MSMGKTMVLWKKNPIFFVRALPTQLSLELPYNNEIKYIQYKYVLYFFLIKYQCVYHKIKGHNEMYKIKYNT